MSTFNLCPYTDIFSKHSGRSIAAAVGFEMCEIDALIFFGSFRMI